MKLDQLLVWVFVFMIAMSGAPPALAQAEFPEIRSIAVVVYDADYGNILFEKNLHQRRSIASLTKIMTLLYTSELVQEGALTLSTSITASANAASRGGTEIKLSAGDQFTLEELLYATALQSANDAAVAIAEYVGGSEREFARLMSERAVELGLMNTNFVDSTGLLSIYSGNYSTAYELTILTDYAMQNELFYRFVSTKEYYLAPQNRVIRNTNPFLGDVPGIDGVKTGATTPAGHTLVTSLVQSDRRLIVVVLGAPSRDQRNDESLKLVEWAYDRLEVLIPDDQVVGQVIVPDGVDFQVNAVPARDFSLFIVDDDQRNITTEVKISEGVHAPVDVGDVVGEMIVFHNGDEVGRLDVVAQQPTGLASFLRRIYNRLFAFVARVL